MKSFIPWVGGKRSILHIILECFPNQYERYIEPFGGGGSVILGKPKTPFEVYNDFDGDLVNLFRCVKYRPFRLLKEIHRMPYNARQDFPILQRMLDGENFYNIYLEEELKIAGEMLSEKEFEEIEKILMGKAHEFDVIRAAAFYLQCHYSYAGGRTSIDCRGSGILRTLPAILMAYRRLAEVFIENKDFEALLGQYDRPGAFFYLDPPYYMTERMYKAAFTREDHVRLRDKLASLQGKWLLSYNDCPEIRELYKDYYIIEFERLNSIAQQFDAGCQFKEVLIANYDLEAARSSKQIQMNLFNYYEERISDL